MKKLSNLFTIAFFFLALLSACGTGENSNNNSNSGNSASDTIPPLVTSINPVNNATDVAINSAITATFTEAMDVSSITTLTFIVNDGSSNISGTVSYVGTTATFTPSASLSYSTPYTATITTGVRDSAGNAMAGNFTWSFTTGSAPDTTPPAVSSTNPANNATGVAINTAITATFSENMDVSSITTLTFIVNDGSNNISGTVSYVGTTATFTPSAPLSYSTPYTATITTGIKDAAGNPITSNYSWSFTTGTAPDTTPPTVIDVDPGSGAANVTINSTATVTFSETMDAASVTTATFTLSNGVGPVLGTVTNNNTIATFTPLSPLAFNNTYTAVVTTGVKDAAGNPMTSNYSWSFRTVKPPVAAGTDHTAALKSDGTLWTWGDNSKGQLGNGNTTGTDSNVPVQIGSATDWIAIAAGKDHTLAIKRNGTLWAWGRNYYIVTGGQLGLGDKLNRFAPTQVGADTNWAHVAAGSYHTVAVKTNGTLWTWGENSQGQLGLNDTAERLFPTQVGTDTNWAFSAAGTTYTVAIKTDGTLWTWGENGFGALGLGDAVSRFIPTQVGTSSNWVYVAAWNYHTLGIKNDGTLWAWGYNWAGQLGVGDTVTRRVPTQVATDTDWAFAAEAGGGHSVAIKRNGAFWTWGNNLDGQLGDGTNVNKLAPTNISITY